MVVRQLVSLLLAAAFTPLSSLSAYAQQDASAVDIGTKAAEGKPADTFAHDLMTQSVEVLNNSAAYVGDANELMATEKVCRFIVSRRLTSSRCCRRQQATTLTL